MSFFILLSSIASVTGSRGQCSYSAANTFQDGFARREVLSGRPCISLNLGSIMSVGFVAEKDLTSTLRGQGFEGVSKAQFLALMDYVCDPACPIARDPNRCQLIAGLASAETIPPSTFQNFYWTAKPMLRPLLRLNSFCSQSSSAGDALTSEQQAGFSEQFVAAAADAHAAQEVALAALVDRLAKLLAVSPKDIDTRRPVSSMGIDSLVALEVRYWVSKELQAEISAFDVLNAEGLERLAAMVIERSKIRKSNI